MTMASEVAPAKRRTRWTRRPGRRAVRREWSGELRLDSARHFDFDPPGQGLDSPRQLLIRAIGQLEHSDWAILFTVGMAIAAIGVLGLLSIRLASLGPSGAATSGASALPTPTASPLAGLAPSAPPTGAVQPPPTATAAPQVVSTVDAGSPGAGARLRAEPRLEAAIVERIVHGTQVAEVGPEASEGARTWRQVRSPSGNLGWMDASLLRRAAGR